MAKAEFQNKLVMEAWTVFMGQASGTEMLE